MQKSGFFCLAVLTAAFSAQALTLPSFGTSQARVAQGPQLDTALALTWNGIKSRNITAYGNSLVHRPKSEYPGDAVSESQGYGMLVALLMNDQTTFNSIWDAAEKYMVTVASGKASYNWWRCQDGSTSCNGPTYKDGPASDADEDIALSLIFADSLVKKGKWSKHTSPKGVDYAARAQSMLKSLWDDMVDQGRYLKPGSWGGASALNPGYFSPAWYRVFAAYDSDASHAWTTLIDQSYQTILANPGASKGLVPDWSAGTGAILASGPGYNAFANGQWFYKDAIRVHWRLALDWLWNGEPRAKKFLDNAYGFVKDPADANFFQLDGSAIPLDSLFKFDGGALSRPRREHSHLTTAMWACAAMSQGSDAAAPWADELLSFHESGADFWGHASDAAGEDTLHNEMYFDQFLAWFGAAVLSGRFANIPEDLTDPDPSLQLAWKDPPPTKTLSLDFQDGPFQETGLLNKAAAWRVSILTKDSSIAWTTSGHSDTVSFSWNGQSSAGAPFPQGWALVTFSAKGMPDTRFYVWVAHQKDLRADDSWLVLDSCREASLSPNFGTWASFNNASNGGTSKISYGLSGSGSDRGLRFRYDLGTGGYQYGGLEWNAQDWTGLPYATKVRFKARADHQTVLDFYVLQSNITDGNNLHVLDTIGTTWKTYEHVFSGFTPRLSGGTTLDMSKATGLHWHIQHDKCLNSAVCDTGNVLLADVLLGGSLDKMYNAPAASKTMPDSVPSLGIQARMEQALRLATTATGLFVETPLVCQLVLRDLSGRVLSRQNLSVGRTLLPQGASGMIIAEVHGEGWRVTRLLHVLR
jgi:endo-1,4-beta-D-glucanase Y